MSIHISQGNTETREPGNRQFAKKVCWKPFKFNKMQTEDQPQCGVTGVSGFIWAFAPRQNNSIYTQHKKFCFSQNKFLDCFGERMPMITYKHDRIVQMCCCWTAKDKKNLTDTQEKGQIFFWIPGNYIHLPPGSNGGTSQVSQIKGMNQKPQYNPVSICSCQALPTSGHRTTIHLVMQVNNWGAIFYSPLFLTFHT